MAFWHPEALREEATPPAPFPAVVPLLFGLKLLVRPVGIRSVGVNSVAVRIISVGVIGCVYSIAIRVYSAGTRCRVRRRVAGPA